jgi:hypothetical protein
MMVACSSAAGSPIEGNVPGAEARVPFDAFATALSVDPLDLDIAVGSEHGPEVQLLTTLDASWALFGPQAPLVNFARNWLLVWRPALKSSQSRLTITRVELSLNGNSLTAWATERKPPAGCQPFRPNEVAVVRVPSRSRPPTSVRIIPTQTIDDCGAMLVGAANRPSACHRDEECMEGLTCTGLSLMTEGVCEPRWMEATMSLPASGRFSTTLPRNGAWHRFIVPVSRLASVPVDAWVQVFVEGVAASEIRLRLTTPSGTVSAPFLGEPGGIAIPVPVPHDEPVNGDWSIEVQAGSLEHREAVIRGLRLTLTSRLADVALSPQTQASARH